MKDIGNIKNIRDGNTPQISVWMQPFANQKEHQQFLKDLAISTEFEMRYRGLRLFYGRDFITYKREKPSDKNRNEFLRIISQYMTHYLEDNCPSSWKQCQPSFWEELIFSFYPDHIKISPTEKEVETFLFQLKKFVRWLDKREGTSWYSVVERYTLEASPELKICEHLLNSLFLNDYPLIHHEKWNIEQDLEQVIQKIDQCSETKEGTFKVTSMIEETVVLTDVNTTRTYYIKGLPCHLIVPDLKMSGMIGKQKGDVAWNWYQTEGIYPPRGKKLDYLKSIRI